MSTSVSLVKDRGYVSIAGPDAKKLLQGLTTNNVQALHPGKCQAQAFLSAKVKYKRWYSGPIAESKCFRGGSSLMVLLINTSKRTELTM